MQRGTRVLVSVLFLSVFGAVFSLASPRRASALASSPTRRALGTYDAAVKDVSKKRKYAEVLADAEPGSWSRRAKAASEELSYAQLTGDYAAYEMADRSIREAFRIARGSIDSDAVGPLLLQAQIHYELHRLRPALESLRVPEQQAAFFHDDRLLAEVISLRGAITFALGRYDEGLSLLRQSVALEPNNGHKQRLAIALAHVGGDAEAKSLLIETEQATDSPRGRSWIALQLGKMALERGERHEARRRLEAAVRLFPGSWHAEEHLAELDAMEGHRERAEAAYRALVEKTGDPEFMDALAELVAPDSKATADELAERSNAIYAERLVKLPEASYGHALEHFLRMVPDADKGIAVAEKNAELRPNGEALTRLAQAYVRGHRLQDARNAIDRVLASAWASAESYATASVIMRLAGDGGATAMANEATRRNPFAMDEIAWLEPL